MEKLKNIPIGTRAVQVLFCPALLKIPAKKARLSGFKKRIYASTKMPVRQYPSFPHSQRTIQS
jgi:hypothetical protein